MGHPRDNLGWSETPHPFLDPLAFVSFPLGQEHLSAVEPITVCSGAKTTGDTDGWGTLQGGIGPVVLGVKGEQGYMAAPVGGVLRTIITD